MADDASTLGNRMGDKVNGPQWQVNTGRRVATRAS